MPSDEIIETMARAIHDHWQGAHGRSWGETCQKLAAQADDFRAKARAALSAAEAAGWVMVPKEPTVGMFRALTASWPQDELSKTIATAWGIGTFPEDYRAMIEARP